MKITSIAIIALSICTLSFFMEGHHGKESSASNAQAETVYANTTEGQENSDAAFSPGAVKIRPARRQLIGVKVAPVEKRPMTYLLRLYGRVVPDETRTYRINASTDSWIRELSDITTGSIVRKNQILAEALAPAYYNAQVTYLITLDNIDRIKQQLGGQLRHQQGDLANNQMRVGVQALQNLGITDAQIEELANTRRARPYLQVRSPTDGLVLSRNLTLNQWFKAGEEFYSIADIGKVWVYADVYEDEAIHMRPGMAVGVEQPQTGKTFRASVGEVIPLFDPDARTLKVRLDVDNPLYELRPDMFVDVEIPITKPPSVNVPADAILDAGTTKIVYVDVGNGTFEPRRVKTGWRLGRRVQIISGIKLGEKIAVSGNFLIDSESRMELASLGAGVRMSTDPVCGRYVNEEEAEMLETTSTYQNKTFYFSSDQCKEAFEKEPEKYVSTQPQMKTEEADAAVAGPQRSWADLLAPIKAGPNKQDGTKSGETTNDSLGDSASRIIDWNGPEKEGAPPPEWNKGWGGFPGAKYLGIKREDKAKSSAKSAVTEPGGVEKADAQKGGAGTAARPDVGVSEGL